MGRRAGPPALRLRGGVWYARFTAAGRRFDLSTDTADRVEAERRAAELHAERVLVAIPGSPPRTGRPVLGSLADLSVRFLEWTAAQGRDARYVEEQGYHFGAHFLPRWRFLRQVTAQAIAAYQVDRAAEVSTVTLYKELVTLSRFLRWCRREGLLDDVPEFERPRQATDYQVPAIAPEDVRRFLAALPCRAEHPRRYPVREWATWAWAMALRATEASSIRWADVDLAAERVTVRAEIDKTGRAWVLPLTREALDVLRAEAARPHEPGDPVIAVHGHGVRRLGTTLANTAAALGLPRITAHHLRHFRISEWANSTRRLAAVQFLARHLSIATTARYVRSTTEAAAEALREMDSGADRGGDSGARQGRMKGRNGRQRR